MARTEAPGKPKADQCYAIRCSVLDADDEELATVAASSGAARSRTLEECEDEGVSVLYEGDPISLSCGGGAWVPVVVASDKEAEDTETMVVLPVEDSPVEAIPGIWNTGDRQGMVCVVNHDEFDTVLEPGTKVAEIHPADIQMRVCQQCGHQDTDAWIVNNNDPKCDSCGAGRTGGPSAC